jgi:hypothetical protein
MESQTHTHEGDDDARTEIHAKKVGRTQIWARRIQVGRERDAAEEARNVEERTRRKGRHGQESQAGDRDRAVGSAREGCQGSARAGFQIAPLVRPLVLGSFLVLGAVHRDGPVLEVALVGPLLVRTVHIGTLDVAILGTLDEPELIGPELIGSLRDESLLHTRRVVASHRLDG